MGSFGVRFSLAGAESQGSATLEAVPGPNAAAAWSCAEPRHRNLLGLAFADCDAAAAARLIAERPPGAPFEYVVTPNADHLTRLARYPSLVPLYDAAWLRLMDSRVVAAGARLLRLPAPAVAPGSDVTRLLLLEHLHPGERITIVGLAPELLTSLVARCGLASPAHCYPPMGFDAADETLRRTVDFVLANPARFVFVAVGSPRQERLCAALRATGQATGTALCVGASLEFLTGTTPRAPLWMQHVGLEWLHRLVGNPKRLARRYLVDSPPVFQLLLNEKIAGLRSARRLGVPVRSRADEQPSSPPNVVFSGAVDRFAWSAGGKGGATGLVGRSLGPERVGAPGRAASSLEH